jgi:hypothetical protein
MMSGSNLVPNRLWPPGAMTHSKSLRRSHSPNLDGHRRRAVTTVLADPARVTSASFPSIRGAASAGTLQSCRISPGRDPNGPCAIGPLRWHDRRRLGARHRAATASFVRCAPPWLISVLSLPAPMPLHASPLPVALGNYPPTNRSPNAVRSSPATPAAPDRVAATRLPAPLRALGASLRCAPVASVSRRRWPGLVGGNDPSD